MTASLPEMMRQLVRHEAVMPDKWAENFALYGWTPEMIEEARDAEIARKLRDRVEEVGE